MQVFVTQRGLIRFGARQMDVPQSLDRGRYDEPCCRDQP